MSKTSEWIRVELNPGQIARARRWAKARHDDAQGNIPRPGRKADRGGTTGTIRDDTIGMYGEIAVDLYENSRMFADYPPADYWKWKNANQPGTSHDVAGWEVKTVSRSSWDLGFKRRTGRFLLVLAHEAPVLWLAGWIDMTEVTESMITPGKILDKPWYRVAKEFLHPLPEKNGYRRRGWLHPENKALVYWCEVCDTRHPIVEHQACRDRLGRGGEGG